MKATMTEGLVPRPEGRLQKQLLQVSGNPVILHDPDELLFALYAQFTVITTCAGC